MSSRHILSTRFNISQFRWSSIGHAHIRNVCERIGARSRTTRRHIIRMLFRIRGNNRTRIGPCMIVVIRT